MALDAFPDDFSPHPDWRAIRRRYGRIDSGTVYLRLRHFRQRRVQALRSPHRRDRDGIPLTFIDALIGVLKDTLASRSAQMRDLEAVAS
jgi:hypothetical protein